MTALPDQLQRSRALTDHAATLLIEAGAGSGKTSLMAGRVVLMLAAGIAPRNIAAITFTELAAGELFTRIAKVTDELLANEVPENLAGVLPDGLDGTQRTNLEAARQQLGHLTATTIHGFCQQLVRPYPVEANLDPGARIMDAAEAALVWQDLLKQFLRARLDQETDGAVLAAFVEVAGNGAEATITNIAGFLRDRRMARPADIFYDAAALATFRASIDAFVSWVDGVGFEEPTTSELAAELTDVADQFEALLGTDPNDATLVRFALLPNPLSALTQKFTWRKWQRKGKWETAAATAGRSKAEGGRLSAEGDALYQTVGETWETLLGIVGGAAFRVLIDEFDELLISYQTYKREAALLDFDDLLLTARDLLAQNDDVRQALAERYRHVLVDEFQDTDPTQAEILWRLCGDSDGSDDWRNRRIRDGALFAVGDPKQAIYRFRGADVATYVAARDALHQQLPDNLLEVTANFRSLRPILDWVNECFSGPLSADGQPGFQNLSSVREPADERPSVVRLEVAVTAAGDKPTQNELRESEAGAVAELCRRLVGAYPIKDGARCVRPGDIVLLAPTGTQLWRYERALERVGIPVASQAGKGFFRRQEVQDMIAISRILADSRDTVAFGALMRGPLVGLTEEELLDIVASLPEIPDSDRLPTFSLRTPLDDISHPLAREILGVLHGLIRRARGTTPFELLAEAIEELRVRPLLNQRHSGGAERALANVDLFLEMASPYDGRGIGAFATDMRAKWENAESEIEGRPDAEEQAVHLITMHSAKGLEWPVAIPVNTMTALQQERGLLHDRTSDEIVHYLGPVPHARYERLLFAERAEQDFERQRLLYVATTRAAELLVIPMMPGDPTGWLRLVDFDAESLPIFDIDIYPEDLPEPAAEIENPQDPATFAGEATRIFEATRTIEWCQPSRHETTDEATAFEETLATVFVDEKPEKSRIQGGPVRGTILHKLMEEILSGETANDSVLLEARANDLITQLGEAPVPNPTDGLSPAELSQTVSATLDLPEIADLRDRLVAELPIFGHEIIPGPPVKETATVGLVDALVYDANDAIELIIDWKSDVAPTQATIERYRSQVREYLSATGVARGLVVYMSLGHIDEISSP